MSVPFFYPDLDWLSDCCGVPPLGPVFQWTEIKTGGEAAPLASGVCSKCKESTNFSRDNKPQTKGKHEQSPD